MCAVYFATLAVVVAAVLEVGEYAGKKPAGRLARISKYVFASKTIWAALALAVVGTQVVRVVRDNFAVVDVVTALLVILWAACIRGFTETTAMPRGRRRLIRAAATVMPAWVTVVALFHLH